MKNNRQTLFTAIILFVVIVSLVANPKSVQAICGPSHIIYVSTAGTGAGGCTWATAYQTLQSALAVASGTDPDQIWVQAGTYYPDEGTGQVNNLLTSTYTLINGVSVYGGFDGTETLLTQRDPTANVTILSGDIDQVGGNAFNAYNVVTVTGALTDTYVLDGFTITAGNSALTGIGGGIYIEDTSPTLANLIITANNAGSRGGGVYVISVSQTLEANYSSPTFTDVAFNSNTANIGAGLYIQNGSPVLTRVTFTGNAASTGAGGGMNSQTFGGIGVDEPNLPTLTDVSFTGNTAVGGGGLYNNNSTTTLNNVTFSGNVANRRGGGILNEQANPTLTNVTFSGNTSNESTGAAPWGGGGILNLGSDPVLNNVTFNGNNSVNGSGTAGGDAMKNMTDLGNTSTPVINNSIFWGDGGISDEILTVGTSTATVVDSVVQGGCPALATCTNVINSDPLLSALASNGGFTQTMAISALGSAFDAGGVNAACAATDQRGTVRPQGVACDIGAYEIADTTAPTLNSFTRFNPLTTPTNADTLVFRATFSETVVNVSVGDFAVNGATTATVTLVTPISGTVYEVTVSGGDLAGFNGVVGLNLAGGQNIADTAGNALPNTEPLTDETYLVDNTAPTVTIGAPSLAITNTGPVDFPITVASANTINLLAANVTLNTTGTATGTVSVTNGTTANPTVTISAITGNGTIGISIAAGIASDLAGNTSAAAGPSATFIVDNTAPTVTIGAPSLAITNTGPVDFPITVAGANTINLLAANVTLNITGTATGTVSVTNGTTANPTVTISGITGNGTIGISIAAGIASDTAGNTSAAAGPSATFIVDNTAPTVTIGAPSLTITNTGPVDFPITVAGANTINLLAGNVTLNTTGTATGTVSVTNGTTATPTVTISGITGDGTIGISIAAGVASDLAGNTSAAAGPSATFTVDNTAPTVTIGAPSLTITNTGPVDFPITVAGANTINLLAANVTLNTTGTATGTISVTNGTTATPTVTISGITGNGTIGISIAAGIASDTAGNTSAAAGPSATFTVDNIAPTVTIGAPSVAITNTGPVDFPITIAGANTINLLAANVTLNTTGTATGTVSVTNGTTANPTVTISGITGNGTIGISIAAGIASDLAGNTSAAAGPSATFTVDNTAPTVSIGAPSVAITTIGPVDFPITVAGANTINLVAANVTLNTTGTATGTISVTNGTTATPTVTISGITGDGTIGISIAAGIASDLAGNTSAAAGPSTTFTVDNTAPTVSIGAPSLTITNTGPVDFPITVAGANTINLLAANVTLNTTGTATGTISVTNGTTANPTVTISGITGDGTIGISIAAGVASDLAGNTSAAAGPSATFTVDNTAPTVTIGAPSLTITNTGPVDFPITVAGANTINLTVADITLNTTGTATGTISVTNGTTANPTVTISAITGNGTIGISIAAGIASDLAGNTSAAAGPSATFTVDNIAPTVTIGAPSLTITNTGPVDFPITVTGANTINLVAGNVTLNTTGTATGTVSVTNGTTANPTVTISSITGNGTIGISIAAGIASDLAGNTSAAAGPSATFTVDNTAPTVSIGAPSLTITNTGPVDFPITVAGANTINLLAANVTLNTTGTATGTVSITNGTTATPTVTISGITGNGTIGISIAAGIASDLAGNTSAAAGPSATFTVDNTAPTVTIGAPSVILTSTGPVDFPITVAGANTINLLAANVTLNTTGTATGTVSVTNGTTATPTVTISGITGNGTIGISIAAGIASDLAGNTSAAAGPSATFTVDNTGPAVAIGAPSLTITNTGPVDFPVTITGATTINLLAANITLNTTGTATGTVSVTNGTTANPTVTISGITGNGTIGISIAAGIASDGVGNTSPAAGPSATFTVDNTAPTVTIGAPSLTITTAGPVDFPITVTGANTINLIAGNITLNTTGTATGTVSVTNGTTANPTVTISGITGNGTIGISIAAGIASDTAGNTSAAAGPSTTFTVDNTAPTVSIGAPSLTITTAGPVDFPITVTGANTINLIAGNITLNTTGTATGTVSVTNGTTANPTVTISGITGNGTIGISIAAGIASDTAGNTSAAAGPSTTFTVDNTAPTVAIGAPSLTITNTGPVDFPITVAGANTINLLAANVTLNTTGTATGTISVTNGTTANPTVTISGITGDGTMGISIAAGIASDGVGNTSPAAGPSATFTVDNTGPTVTIDQAGGQLDPTNTGPINFTVVFSESTSNFATGDVTLTGTAVGGSTIATVTGGPTIYNVAVNGMIGDGTVIATINAGVATDALGNGNSASTSTDNTVTYDTSGPIVTIGAPSVAITTTGPVDFPITIVGATTINLTVADITLNTTGTATGTISVTNGATATPTVTISATTGSGTIGISIAAAVASDALGNTSLAAGPSATFIVDNGGPVVTASVPANSSSVTGPTQLTVTFNEDVSAATGNNIANYLLLNDSGDGFDDAPTVTTCLTGSNPNGGNDLNIAINSAVYANGGGSGPFVSTLGINGGVPLPVGTYRLYICGTTSIEDLVGNELNNGLNDTIIEFTVIAGTPGGGGGNARASIPATGFAQGEVTSLPMQPADKAYAATDMWIEIPRLNVKMSIVGVPQTKGGWDVNWLGRDAGWLNGSAFPTWSGNSVLTGHVWDALGKSGPFALLKDLKYGDVVKIHAFGQIFTYEIRESSLISPASITTMMKHEEKSWITLITCEVYNEKSETYTYRRMVRAVLISVTAEK